MAPIRFSTARVSRTALARGLILSHTDVCNASGLFKLSSLDSRGNSFFKGLWMDAGGSLIASTSY